jgi:formyltetrahydrofolate deformylase
MPIHILTLSCPDAHGIIHGITGALLELDANILEQEQYSDPDSGLFFARTRFEVPESDETGIQSFLVEALGRFNGQVDVRRETAHRRVLILVSQHDHCLVDLLYRWRIGELPIDIVGIVSNHEVCRPLAEQYGIPFDYLPITKENKKAQEELLRDIVRERDVDLVVLARYMQILSDTICRELSGRVINIHHSFLPGFKGARPYQQAHDRGVKLIGATAHFVTADLDEGPIIEQQVHRVTHAQSADDLAEIGRDIERLVLARAVRLFAEDRVFLNRQRTVVFG